MAIENLIDVVREDMKNERGVRLTITSMDGELDKNVIERFLIDF